MTRAEPRKKNFVVCCVASYTCFAPRYHTMGGNPPHHTILEKSNFPHISHTHSQASWTFQKYISQTYTSQMCTHGGVYLVDVHLTYTGVYLTDMHLMGVYLTSVHLTGVHLMWVYLTNVHLTDVHLMGVHLIYEASLRAGHGWRESLYRHQ